MNRPIKNDRLTDAVPCKGSSEAFQGKFTIARSAGFQSDCALMADVT